MISDIVTGGSILQSLARTLHLSLTSLYLLGISLLLILAVILGSILRYLVRGYGKKLQSSWGDLVFFFLASLPTPLLVWLVLYVSLKELQLPRRYERLGSELISALMAVAVYFFPAQAIVLFLRRMAEVNHHRRQLTQFTVFVVRSLFVLVAAYTVQEILTLPPRYERLGAKVLTAIGIGLFFYALARLVSLYLRLVVQKSPELQRVTEPAAFVARVLFALLAAFIILENLGIHLTVIWTTLGVGSVAVALALQETLSNFFSGLYLLADRPISPGDYIKLDSGYEGYVVQVGWRSTSLRSLGNNIILVPNALLAKAVITNYARPEDRMSLDIHVSVPYGTDARHVEKMLVEVAEEAARDKTEGLLAEFPPSAKLIPGFGPSTLDFTLGVQIRRFVDQYQVQSELRKRILERLQKEGIDVPLPAQRLILDRSRSGSRNGSEADSDVPSGTAAGLDP
jgi:small-conductance mechanosensitive channel